MDSIPSEWEKFYSSQVKLTMPNNQLMGIVEREQILSRMMLSLVSK